MRTFVAVLCGLPVLAQATLTVNSGGGAMFTDVQPAILAAMPGDRIVVAGLGPYGAFTVDRGVDVEAPQGAVVPNFSVTNVPSAQRVRVAGFTVSQTNNGSVSVLGCAGRVLLADLRLAGGFALVSTPNPGLSIANAGDVLVDRGTFRGLDGIASGSPGVQVSNSNVTMLGPLVTGGGGFYGGSWGIVVSSGHLVMRNVNSQGGSGGGNPSGSPGGHGIEVLSGLALALGGCTFTGTPGWGGSPFPYPNGQGVRGNVRYTADTTLVGAASGGTMIPNRPRLNAQPAAAIGSNYTLAIAGDPTQWVALAFDLTSIHMPMPAFDGALHLTGTAIGVGILTLDAQGAGTYTFALPNFSAAQHLLIVVQGGAVAGGAPVLTAPALTYTY